MSSSREQRSTNGRPSMRAAAMALVAGATTLAPGATSAVRATATEPSIVPRPAQLQAGTGAFVADAATRVLIDSRAPGLRPPLSALLTALRARSGLRLPLERARSADLVPAPANTIVFLLDGASGTPARRSEEYVLEVARSSILARSASATGLFYALQSLRQLLPVDIEGFGRVDSAGSADAAAPGADGPGPIAVRIPALRIEDAPRFDYRGMHLDVGRHMFPVAFIKRYLDLMARSKLNRFHWHLTEDQGWRIEIKRYPRLTRVGAFRRGTAIGKQFDPYGRDPTLFRGDGERYGGYYTQEQVREIVAYAAERHITVIPEIEMPGHSSAALAAYPELACTPGPFEVGMRWGIYEDIYCPSEATFEFLEGVLTEVMELFPGTLIHVGGDEAPKARWQASPIAQEVMRREGLADEAALQSWFIRRIERFLNAHGRRLIGWDEILDGGIAPDATVMSWRGNEGGIEAARHGHDVVMSPYSHLYFDYYQSEEVEQEPLAIGGYLPLETVYAFEPVPAELSVAESRHVLGAQANMWTEYMRTPEHVEYMLMPRMLALAEVVWSPASRRDLDDFTRRLPEQLERLDRLGVNYRVPDVRGLASETTSSTATARIELAHPFADAVIRYTLDGNVPGPDAPRYSGPLQIDIGAAGTVVSARAFLPSGRTSPVARGVFRRPERNPE